MIKLVEDNQRIGIVINKKGTDQFWTQDDETKEFRWGSLEEAEIYLVQFGVTASIVNQIREFDPEAELTQRFVIIE